MRQHPVRMTKAKALAAPALGMQVRLFLAALTALCVMMMMASSAHAQIEGCDPKVMEAAQAKAQTRVAYDTAVTEETIDKPDSVLVMTCFNNLAGWAGDNTAGGGGSIFSGDFTGLAGYSTVISDGLSGFYDDYVDAAGNDSGALNYSATALSPTTTCAETQNHWNEVKQEGVQKGIPYPVLSDLGGLAGPITTPAGSGTNFTSNWGVSGGTDNLFTSLQTAIGNLTPPLIPAFAPAATSCLTLQTAGVTGSCP